MLERWVDSKLGLLLEKAKTWTNNREQSAQSSWMTVGAKEGSYMNRNDGYTRNPHTHTHYLHHLYSGYSTMFTLPLVGALPYANTTLPMYSNFSTRIRMSYRRRQKVLLEARWLPTVRFAWTPCKRTVQKESSLSNKCNFRGYECTQIPLRTRF